MTTETQATHTLGPWHIATDPTGPTVITHTTPGLNSHVAVLYPGRLCEEHGDTYANAHLIAAAPDLLAALEAAKNTLQSYHERCDWTIDACSDGGIDMDYGHAAIIDACNAIRKARGQ